jgi:hypothetical protein
MRLMATAERLGCWKVTLASRPMLKLFQFATTVLEVWLMTIALPD